MTGKAERVLFGVPKKKRKRIWEQNPRNNDRKSARNPYERPDRFARLAKQNAVPYRSRAAYKLLEIEHKYQILQGKEYILDLGAAPGSWLQVAREENSTARIVGLDTQVIEPIPSIETQQCDCAEDILQVAERVMAVMREGPDCILCDMAPCTIGQAKIDNIRALRLAEVAFAVAEGVLRRGGDLLIKLRHAGGEGEIFGKARESFGRVQLVKPRASRKGANEIYLLALGKLGEQTFGGAAGSPHAGVGRGEAHAPSA